MHQQIEIRPATLTDLDEILRLLPQMSARVTSAGAQIPMREKAAQILAQILADEKIYLLMALPQGSQRLLGSLMLVIVPNLTYSGQPWAMIENVVVDQTARRSGIGRRLIEAAIQHANQQGCYKIQLISGPKAEQLAFYRDLGFQAENCVGHKRYLWRQP